MLDHVLELPPSGDQAKRLANLLASQKRERKSYLLWR
jgi:hypothetical protein